MITVNDFIHSRRLAAFFLAAALGACSDAGPSIYSAQPYDPEADCLQKYTPIAEVPADELRATCPPVCLVYAGVTYVSTLCAPYPERAQLLTAADSEECAAALAAEACDAGE